MVQQLLVVLVVWIKTTTASVAGSLLAANLWLAAAAAAAAAAGPTLTMAMAFHIPHPPHHTRHSFPFPQCRTLRRQPTTTTALFLRTNLQIPLLDVLEDDHQKDGNDNDTDNDTDTDTDDHKKDAEDDPMVLIPLPSSHLPPVVATPFLYGMQVDRPIHKLLLQEATATTTATTNVDMNGRPPLPFYGHLVWKNPSSDSLVGAIGCTADILVNAPTSEVLNPAVAQDIDLATGEAIPASTTSSSSSSSSSDDIDNNNAAAAAAAGTTVPPSEPSPNTVLCRGGFRFVVTEVIKTIPYPVVMIDEIQDDAEEDDSDMFAAVASKENNNVDNDNDEDNDNDDNDEDGDGDDTAQYTNLSGSELIQQTMRGVQAIVSDNLQQAIMARQRSPLEQQILETSGMMGGVDPRMMEQMRAEEMVAVWEVFQTSLVDDIEPKDRKFAVAIMATELADLSNDIRQQVLVTRDGPERLRIVLKEVNEKVGMTRARKLASQITDKVDEDDRDLKVGVPNLPAWAKTIVKGTRVEYFWNEEFGWVTGTVVEDPQTIIDEILLTIRFEDGETHTLPLTAEDKVRWRPPESN